MDRRELEAMREAMAALDEMTRAYEATLNPGQYRDWLPIKQAMMMLASLAMNLTKN